MLVICTLAKGTKVPSISFFLRMLVKVKIPHLSPHLIDLAGKLFSTPRPLEILLLFFLRMKKGAPVYYCQCFIPPSESVVGKEEPVRLEKNLLCYFLEWFELLGGSSRAYDDDDYSVRVCLCLLIDSPFFFSFSLPLYYPREGGES